MGLEASIRIVLFLLLRAEPLEKGFKRDSIFRPMTESLQARVKRVSTVYDADTGTRRFITLCDARGECFPLEDALGRLDFQENEVLKIENLDRKPPEESRGYLRVDYKLRTRIDTKVTRLTSVPSTAYQPSYPTITIRFLETEPGYKPAPKSGTEEKYHLVQDVNGDGTVHTLREFRDVNGDGHELSYDKSKIYKLYNVKIYQEEHLIHFSHYGLIEEGGDDSPHFANSKVPKTPLIPFPKDYKLLSEDENFRQRSIQSKNKPKFIGKPYRSKVKKSS